jgi:hypothetical protein
MATEWALAHCASLSIVKSSRERSDKAHRAHPVGVNQLYLNQFANNLLSGIAV